MDFLLNERRWAIQDAFSGQSARSPRKTEDYIWRETAAAADLSIVPIGSGF
jgi:hypothetical protein